MKEYTFLAVASVIAALLLEKAVKTGIFKRREFYVFILAIIFFKLLVNGYLTGTGIVIYNPQSFLDVRIGSIPVEDFLFGFSMVSMTIIFWEHFKKKT